MKRIGRIVAGSALILAGIPMLVLPGPGLLAIFGGLTLIASESEWASNLLDKAKRKTADLGDEGRRS